MLLQLCLWSSSTFSCVFCVILFILHVQEVWQIKFYHPYTENRNIKYIVMNKLMILVSFIFTASTHCSSSQQLKYYFFHKHCIYTLCFNSGNTLAWICHGELKPSPPGTEVWEVQSHRGTLCNGAHWYSAPVLISHWTWKRSELPCAAAFRDSRWPVRMLHPADPLWGSDSWPRPGNILGCGARRPIVRQSASAPSNHRDAPPLCSGQPGYWADAADLLQSETSHHKECMYLKKRTGEVLKNQVAQIKGACTDDHGGALKC